MHPPKCDICGKFIAYSDLNDINKIGFTTLYDYVIPEPIEDIFWHLKCEKEKSQNEANDNNY